MAGRLDRLSFAVINFFQVKRVNFSDGRRLSKSMENLDQNLRTLDDFEREFRNEHKGKQNY